MRTRQALVRIGVPVVAAICMVGLTSAPALAMTPGSTAFESVSPKRCVLGGGHIVYRGDKYRGNRHRDWVELRCKGGRYSGERVSY